MDVSRILNYILRKVDDMEERMNKLKEQMAIQAAQAKLNDERLAERCLRELEEAFAKNFFPIHTDVVPPMDSVHCDFVEIDDASIAEISDKPDDLELVPMVNLTSAVQVPVVFGQWWLISTLDRVLCWATM